MSVVAMMQRFKSPWSVQKVWEFVQVDWRWVVVLMEDGSDVWYDIIVGSDIGIDLIEVCFIE